MRKTQIVKWGKGLAVRFPKAVVERAGLREGDAVSIEVLDGRAELRCAKSIPTLEELVAQITLENRHEEIDWGRPVSGRKSGKGHKRPRVGATTARPVQLPESTLETAPVSV